jgi:hypothetical protein
MLSIRGMRTIDALLLRIRLRKELRGAIEYAVALGAAVLASYLILQGRW